MVEHFKKKTNRKLNWIEQKLGKSKIKKRKEKFKFRKRIRIVHKDEQNIMKFSSDGGFQIYYSSYFCCCYLEIE